MSRVSAALLGTVKGAGVRRKVTGPIPGVLPAAERQVASLQYERRALGEERVPGADSFQELMAQHGRRTWSWVTALQVWAQLHQRQKRVWMMERAAGGRPE